MDIFRKLPVVMNAARTISQSVQKAILTELQNKTMEIYRKNIVDVYNINSRIRTKGNYVPLERMLNALKVNFSFSKMEINIFIDDSMITWVDKDGEPVHQVNYPGKYVDLNNALVTSLDEYWRTPIMKKHENEYYLQKTIDEIKNYIQTDFVNFVTNRLKEVGYYGRKR